MVPLLYQPAGNTFMEGIMYSEDDLLMISSLQHLLFCERQFALIHLEQQWLENEYTAEGEMLHEHVHAEGHESRGKLKQEYAMPLRSLEYGLIGKADLVELRFSPQKQLLEAVPVEFKRGKAKENDCDKAQLFAQALCLNEHYNLEIPKGQLYYFALHKRVDVKFSDNLRRTVLAAIDRAHAILSSGKTPKALFERRKCTSCSLYEICMPQFSGKTCSTVNSYIKNEILRIRGE